MSYDVIRLYNMVGHTWHGHRNNVTGNSRALYEETWCHWALFGLLWLTVSIEWSITQYRVSNYALISWDQWILMELFVKSELFLWAAKAGLFRFHVVRFWEVMFG